MFNSSFQGLSSKQLFFFVLTLGLVIILPIFIFVALQKQNIKREATANTVSLIPSSNTVEMGDSFSIDVVINRADKTMEGVDLHLTYDDSILSIDFSDDLNPSNDGILLLEGLVDASVLDGDPANDLTTAGNGEIRIYGTLQGQASPVVDENINVARLTFTAVSEGVSSVEFTGQNQFITTDSQGYTTEIALDGTEGGGVYTAGGQIQPTGELTITPGNPTATPTGGPENPTPTPTEIPPGTPTLSFKLKFQGVLRQRDDQTVRVTIAGGPGGEDFKKVFEDVVVTSDENGVWSGEVGLVGVPSGSGYVVLIKGPKHLQRKFCDPYPSPQSEFVGYRCGSIGRITLISGVNNVDFTRAVIYAGDLPPQDGVMNARDASDLRLNLTRSNPEALSIADVNFDGVVNTTDYSLLLESMQVEYDEER